MSHVTNMDIRADHLAFGGGEGGVEDLVSAIIFSPVVNKEDIFQSKSGARYRAYIGHEFFSCFECCRIFFKIFQPAPYPPQNSNGPPLAVIAFFSLLLKG